MSLTKIQIELMKHTISDNNRNWFGTCLNGSDSIEFKKLVKMGLAVSRKPASWMGDEVLYSLTNDGKIALDNLPKPKIKKLTKGQNRYQQYLKGEYSETFGEFIKGRMYLAYD